jgi:general secretion pathway protein I
VRTQARKTPRRGFTLLEVVIALAILGLALMAIFQLNAGAVANHVYTKHLTVATLLARSKMTDLEQQLYDDGFSADDQELDGDFSEEGWQSYKWRARILAPRTQDVPPEQLISALFGVPMGEGGLGALFGGGDASGDSSGEPKQGASPMAGAMAGMAQTQLQQMLTQINDAVREVRLTVSWKDGKETESLDLVTHIVSLGQGSDRNGFIPGTNGQVAPSAGQPGSAEQQQQQQGGGPFVGGQIGGGR